LSGKLSIAQAAKLETDKLKALQRSISSPMPATKSEKVNTTDSNANSIDDNTLPVHVVVKGESLFSISKKYNIQMRSIEKWNDLQRSKLLHIGDVIYLTDPKKIAKS